MLFPPMFGEFNAVFLSAHFVNQTISPPLNEWVDKNKLV